MSSSSPAPRPTHGPAHVPTLYDVLDVAPDASAEEIYRAWRQATERLGPGGPMGGPVGGSARRLRLFNEAAEVLLDPGRRAEYDASLPAEEPAEEPDEKTVPSAAVDTAEHRTTTAAAGTEAAGDVRHEPGEAAARPRGPHWAVLAALAVLTAVAVGLAAYFVSQRQDAEAYQEALDRAPSAAENAAVAVLSYDHESLEADRDAATRFLTGDYREDYLRTFDNLVRENATEVKATVEAEVLASAPVAVGDRDPSRVPVLLFVNQRTTSSATSGEPSVALNRAVFDMVEVDGTWLVDGITSY